MTAYQKKLPSSLSIETDSPPSSSPSSDDALSYALRENPKRSVRIQDLESSHPSNGFVIQDREIESPKKPTQKRSKLVNTTTTEEDLAPLMTLAIIIENDLKDNGKLKSRNGKEFTWETSKKVFESFQALGGHRGHCHHKKIKLNTGGTSSSPVTYNLRNETLTIPTKSLSW